MRIFLCFIIFYNCLLASQAKPSLEDMISQMIMVGFEGQYTSQKSVKLIENEIKNANIGGILLLKRNVASKEQLQKLLSHFNAIKTPLVNLVAIDQEGGYVSRFSKNKGFRTYPSARKVASLRSIDEAKELYFNMAQRLKNIGINYNLAPVVDVLVSETKFEKQRCFSKYSSIVTTYANAFIEAFDDAKVNTALKHFPGYASALNDAHIGKVDISLFWQYEELRPYYDLIKMNKAKSIMASHVYLRQFDENYPVSLSKIILTDILRGILKYNGVIISDDLMMRGLSEFSFKQKIIKSINAGVDILLFSDYHEGKKRIPNLVKNIVLQAIKSGELDKQNIIKSYERIVKFKSFIK